MKVNQQQKTATAWKRGLDKLNSAKEGQVQITYKDVNGSKQVGYIAITDIDLVVDDKTISLGGLLAEILEFNTKVLNQVKTMEKALATIGNDYLIIKTDELGFIKAINDFNNKVDIVIANQPIPSDFSKGYYYIKDGKIILDEQRKLELFPDFV